jgi:ribosome-binding ATPase YchF (GTP1/OBG family)
MNFLDKKITVAEALISLSPGSSWAANGDNYEDVEWMDSENIIPSKDSVEKEIIRLQKEWDLKKYQSQRKHEYPDFMEYIDGVVKGDQDQINKYIEDCKKVKEKYPKPEQ